MPVIIVPHFWKMVALLTNLETNNYGEITNVLIEKTSQGMYGTPNLRKSHLLNESMFTQDNIGSHTFSEMARNGFV